MRGRAHPHFHMVQNGLITQLQHDRLGGLGLVVYAGKANCRTGMRMVPRGSCAHVRAPLPLTFLFLALDPKPRVTRSISNLSIQSGPPPPIGKTQTGRGMKTNAKMPLAVNAFNGRALACCGLSVLLEIHLHTDRAANGGKTNFDAARTNRVIAIIGGSTQKGAIVVCFPSSGVSVEGLVRCCSEH